MALKRAMALVMVVVAAPTLVWAAPFTEGLNTKVDTFSGIHGSYTAQDHEALADAPLIHGYPGGYFQIVPPVTDTYEHAGAICDEYRQQATATAARAQGYIDIDSNAQGVAQRIETVTISATGYDGQWGKVTARISINGDASCAVGGTSAVKMLGSFECGVSTGSGAWASDNGGEFYFHAEGEGGPDAVSVNREEVFTLNFIFGQPFELKWGVSSRASVYGSGGDQAIVQSDVRLDWVGLHGDYATSGGTPIAPATVTVGTLSGHDIVGGIPEPATGALGVVCLGALRRKPGHSPVKLSACRTDTGAMEGPIPGDALWHTRCG